MTREELERAVLEKRVNDARARRAAAPEDEKSKLMNRVGPPTMGDEAVMKDVPALTSLGYAASEVPIAGPLVKRAIGKVSPGTEEELDLGKARYEQENPKTATALQLAAPLALPLGPAGTGAQAAYQGAVSAADALARGGGLGEAGASGTLTTGASLALGKAGRTVAPYLKKAGDAVNSAIEPITAPVASYLRKLAAGRAAESALAGQKKLNSGLSESAKQNVGNSMLDAGIMNSNFLGDSPKNLAAKTAKASSETNGEIKRLIDELTAEGVQPSKASLLEKLQKLRDGKRLNQDTATYHSYLENEAADLAAIPDEDFTLRFLQDRKNDVPYDRLAESTVKKVRKKFSGALQDTQDEAVETTGKKDAYKALQKKASGLIDASKGAKERADRAAANRNFSPSDYGMGIGGAVVGSVLGSQHDQGALGGVATGATLGMLNRTARSRGSSMLSANLNSLSRMASTKFGPILEAAAQRGKGAIGITHHLLYKNNPEYRQTYDAIQPDLHKFPMTDNNESQMHKEGH